VTTQQQEATSPSHTQTIVGTVTTVSGQKTVTVSTSRRIRHKRYLKVIRQVTQVKAHDETSQCKQGDLVEIQLARPMSRTKRWRVVRVVKKANELAAVEAST
jgi:small subunit ribosomal protein S17